MFLGKERSDTDSSYSTKTKDATGSLSRQLLSAPASWWGNVESCDSPLGTSFNNPLNNALCSSRGNLTLSSLEDRLPSRRGQSWRLPGEAVKKKVLKTASLQVLDAKPDFISARGTGRRQRFRPEIPFQRTVLVPTLIGFTGQSRHLGA